MMLCNCNTCVGTLQYHCTVCCAEVYSYLSVTFGSRENLWKYTQWAQILGHPKDISKTFLRLQCQSEDIQYGKDVLKIIESLLYVILLERQTREEITRDENRLPPV